MSFETILQKEIKNKKSILNVDFNNIQPKVYVDEASSRYRMDNNNVDIDVEMAEEAKVYARYNALITRVNAQLNRFTTVLQNIK